MARPAACDVDLSIKGNGNYCLYPTGFQPEIDQNPLIYVRITAENSFSGVVFLPTLCLSYFSFTNVWSPQHPGSNLHTFIYGEMISLQFFTIKYCGQRHHNIEITLTNQYKTKERATVIQLKQKYHATDYPCIVQQGTYVNHHCLKYEDLNGNMEESVKRNESRDETRITTTTDEA